MSSAAGSSRVRKACLPCIRAKAKCSISEHRPEECHRCIRLNKECIFEVIAKKPGPGPKSRSRVRQLEQRVESLIDLIAAKNTDASVTSVTENTVPTQIVTPESSAESNAPPNAATDALHLKKLAPPWLDVAAYQNYDPVTAGLIEEQHAYRLIDEFKESFVWAFPFVVVEVDGPALRRQEPFLFHAILTVTAYNTPGLQYVLSDKLRHEIGRIVEYSRKSLGILQGLLVYGGWYHGFYHPMTQQLTVVVQLCVALVHDLGLSKTTKAKPGKWPISDCGTGRPKGTLAEKRAFLGTYFLSVAFAQAWRKRPTMPYTRSMARFTDAFHKSSIPSDALVIPLLKASELLSRVHDHFSLSDIDNADVKGDILLSMSTNNFLAELTHIKEFTSSNPLIQNNTTITLFLTLVDITIHEACLHSSLWSTVATTAPQSTIRLKMLHRSMEGATSYLKTLLTIPQPLLYHLGLGSWCGWFYAFIVICKLVFLQENERLGHTQVEDMPGEIDNLMPQIAGLESFLQRDKEDTAAADTNPALDGLDGHPGWDALALTRQYDLCRLLDQVMELFRFSLPKDFIPWRKPREERDSLYSLSCIQHTMLQAFTKRIDRLAHFNATESATNQPTTAATAPSQDPSYANTWQFPQPPSILTHPFANFMNFDAINFDGVTMPASNYPQQQGGQEMLGDWMWDMVMDDFTMPSL